VINLRYHLISVASIFFALAVGIALGAGPLQGSLADNLVNQASEDRVATDESRAEVAASDALDLADGYASATARTVVGSVLAGRTVMLAPLPGANPDDVRATGDLVAAAGGTVVSTVTVTAKMLDPADRVLADGLARNILGQDDDNRSGTAGTYPLLSQAFALAFLTRSDDPPLQDSDANGAEATLVEAGFINVEGGTDRLAQLVLLVAGDPPADAVEGQAEVEAELAAGFALGSLGAVVAGASAADGSAVAAVRGSASNNTVSSVDTVDLPAGQVAAVLAVAEQARGGVGNYGLTGDDGAVPATGSGG